MFRLQRMFSFLRQCFRIARGACVGTYTVTDLSVGDAETLVLTPHLHLDGLLQLEEPVAKVLAEFKGEILSLNGLRTLTPEVARALAEFKGSGLLLSGLRTLTPEVARALAEFKGSGLGLDGLRTPTAELACALAEFKGSGLLLSGLRTLTPEVARALAEFKGSGLGLNGLRTVTPEVMRVLDEFKGEVLCLDGLRTLTLEAARALAKFDGEKLSLSGLRTLTPEAARALAEFKGEKLSLDGLRTLQAELASTQCQELSLAGLEHPSDGEWRRFMAARILIKGPSEVTVPEALVPIATSALDKVLSANNDEITSGSAPTKLIPRAGSIKPATLTAKPGRSVSGQKAQVVSRSRGKRTWDQVNFPGLATFIAVVLGGVCAIPVTIILVRVISPKAFFNLQPILPRFVFDWLR